MKSYKSMIEQKSSVYIIWVYEIDINYSEMSSARDTDIKITG